MDTPTQRHKGIHSLCTQVIHFITLHNHLDTLHSSLVPTMSKLRTTLPRTPRARIFETFQHKSPASLVVKLSESGNGNVPSVTNNNKQLTLGTFVHSQDRELAIDVPTTQFNTRDTVSSSCRSQHRASINMFGRIKVIQLQHTRRFPRASMTRLN